MTRLFSVGDFERLALEARGQFDWAKDEGEHHPEAIAFLVDGKVIGGHTRSFLGETALTNALTYLQDAFGQAAGTSHPLPDRVVIMTQMRRNIDTPRQPSSALQRDLRLIMQPQQDGTPLKAIVISDAGTASKTMEISAQPA